MFLRMFTRLGDDTVCVYVSTERHGVIGAKEREVERRKKRGGAESEQ